MLEIPAKTIRPSTKSGAKRRPKSGIGLDTDRLEKMIKKLMDNLENEEISSKASVGELLKLLQIYKELTAEQVKEVEVRWVDRLCGDGESER